MRAESAYRTRVLLSRVRRGRGIYRRRGGRTRSFLIPPVEASLTNFHPSPCSSTNCGSPSSHRPRSSCSVLAKPHLRASFIIITSRSIRSVKHSFVGQPVEAWTEGKCRGAWWQPCKLQRCRRAHRWHLIAAVPGIAQPLVLKFCAQRTQRVSDDSWARGIEQRKQHASSQLLRGIEIGQRTPGM